MSDTRDVYNVKDCIATRQVYDALAPQLSAPTDRAYRALMGLQGACLGVQMRGIRVDEARRAALVESLKADIETRAAEVQTIVGRPLEKFVNSPAQLKAFFYEELGLRTQKNAKTDKVSTDETALQRIAKRSVAIEAEGIGLHEKTSRKDRAARVAELILECRDLGKQASSLSAALLENGRMRTTLVAGGTESFRLSAHKACTNKGHNQQNQDKRLRGCYIPDDGFVIGQMDQTTAESMVVAYDSQDEAYIAAHLAGNTHVTVAQMVWPNQPWPADKKAAKAFAKQVTLDGKPPHGRNALYDRAKEVQHASNFLQSARGLAIRIGAPIKEGERIQDVYFTRFPKIKDWHNRIIGEIKRYGTISCPGGFRHLMLGRRWDEETHRSGVSRVPQSIVAWTNHIVFARLYYQLEDANFQVLGHIHDAIIFQVRAGMEAEYRAKIETLSKVRWAVHGRKMVIPFEIKLGTDEGCENTWEGVS